jgi:hypothetical protein
MTVLVTSANGRTGRTSAEHRVVGPDAVVLVRVMP